MWFKGSANFAFLCIFDRELRRGRRILTKGYLQEEAEASNILKDGESMYSQNGIAGGLHGYYDGWSNFGKCKEGDVPIFVRVRKRKGEDEQYRLSESDASENGVNIAAAVHRYAHARHWCRCTSHP